MENNQFKGFAYTREGNRPTVVYGTSSEDILSKLNSYNIARMEKDKFKNCSIGRLNIETNKYEDYRRYEVATGRDISSVRLQIPPLKKEEFRKVVADLNAAGARFNPHKKQWYITAEQDLQKFQDICNQFSNPGIKVQIPTKKTVLPKSVFDEFRRPEEPEKPDFLIEGVEIQYAVKMQDQQTVIIPETALNMWNIKGSLNEFLDKLNEKALEQLQKMSSNPEQIADESEYSISVSKGHSDNHCTVWFNDGREPVHLLGDEFGIHFPTMETGVVADFISKYLSQQERPELSMQIEYREGDAIDCYVPLRFNVDLDPNQPIYVENVSHVVGNVRSIGNLANTESKIYEILQEGGNVRTIRSDEIYAHDQARVLLRAAADELTGIQFDLLADRNLSAAQMEEIRFGFKDGLSAEQVALYANPNMTPAEMDMCRIGLNSGLGYAEISKLLKETKELSWTDSRKRLNEAIKDHRVIHENFLSESADFYGTQVLVENGKRVISQETMDGLLKHIAEKGIESEPLDFKNCIFRGINFPDNAYCVESFQNTDFSGSEFYHCRIYADMQRSSFRDTVFMNTSFKTSILKQCDFSRSEMTGCRFQETDIIEANFSDAYMKNIYFVGCAMERNDFNKTRMDTVDVSESCGVVDSKHFDTISYTVSTEDKAAAEKMTDRVLWRLSGVSEVSYERKEELQKLFQSEKDGSLDSENESWRLDLSRDEEELIDGWDNKIHEEKRLCENITKLGYKPTEKLVSNIQKLDAITGERHGLKDVRELYRQNNFQNNQELKQTVLDIAEECKQQELARMAAPVNMPG